MANIKLPKIASDFQCFVCGAIFTNDQDRKQHLDKEISGTVRDEVSDEEKTIARIQVENIDSYRHYF